MFPIVLEGVLAVLCLAALLTLVLSVFGATPIGRRLLQARNRRRLERGVPFQCAIHGTITDADLVLTRSGDRMCPRCYAEILND